MPRAETAYGHNWAVYKCTSCRLLVLAQSRLGNQGTKELEKVYPDVESVEEDIPERARNYLTQAVGSIHAPDGAAMLAGSAVDAMLKAKGLTEGTVYNRIDQAVQQHILTQEMGAWAHDVRLGSNRPRHADQDDPHVTPQEARQAIEFAKTLGTVLFVLPNRIANRGNGNS
ncbi:hypothetical protein CHL67_05625 [Prosthecochloris sp. GSB1]|nr:hypothetical protein CHL67_05625 [Prosthecochloris sp. GSB1]